METITALLDEALSLCQSGQLVEGQKIYLQILEREPTNIKALSNLASIALHNGNLDESIALFKTSLSIDSTQPIANYNYGMALQKAKEFENALTAYNAAIMLNPNFIQAYNNRGLTHSELKRHEEALTDFNQAIGLNPDYAEAYNNRGLTHSELKRHENALADFNKAIGLNPIYAEAYNNRGLTHSELKRHEDALADFSRAFEINPEIDYLLGHFMHTKMHLCDWEGIDDLVNKTKKAIGNQQKVATPFIIASLIGCPEIQKQNTENYIKATLPSVPLLPKIEQKTKNKKIKLGYFSADFHNHATMHLMAELFEHHDKTHFELIAFSFGPDLHDEWRTRAKSSFDQFIDVRDKSEIEIAELARLLALDIAVDLKGFTQDARTNIFTHRAAPIQVNYLGFPGTMGAGYIDYIIGDHTLIPEDNKNCYSEKIAYLPNSYQANIKNRSISGKTFTRKEMGLPEESFIFCSFNNNYKITPTVFDSWMRILNRVENSVLWLFKTNDTAVKHLKREAEVRGVNSSRLVFASRLPVEEHLKRIQLADLFLDTLPYNAHTTASDALRVGLPILTLVGDAFSSRVAASLLKTFNLQELITSNQNEYESIAVDIAKNPKKLLQLKSKLKDGLTTSSLYNSTLFTQQIESLYKTMCERNEANLPPAHIYVTNKT
jgi:predicted O-linked N-acetylglucosamine transferase (SPINDLY family)